MVGWIKNNTNQMNGWIEKKRWLVDIKIWMVGWIKIR